MNKGMVLVKDKTGHYKYVKESRANIGSKMFNFLFKTILVLILLVCIYSVYIDAFDVILFDEEMSVEVGSTTQIKLLPKNSFLFDYSNYKYNSSDKSVANIDNIGQIEAYNPGTSIISVRFKHSPFVKTIRLNVEDNNEE